MKRIHWKEVARNVIAALAFERIDRLHMDRSEAYETVADDAGLDEADLIEMGFKTAEQEEEEEMK